MWTVPAGKPALDQRFDFTKGRRVTEHQRKIRISKCLVTGHWILNTHGEVHQCGFRVNFNDLAFLDWRHAVEEASWLIATRST